MFYSFNELYNNFTLPIIVILMLFSFDLSLMTKKTYSQVEFYEIRGEWITFVLKLIMNHVHVSWSCIVSPIVVIWIFHWYCIALLILYELFYIKMGKRNKKTLVLRFVYFFNITFLFSIRTLKLIKLWNVGIHYWEDNMKN